MWSDPAMKKTGAWCAFKLTRSGRSHRQACHEATQELTDILYCGVTNEERVVFLRVLNQLFENVSEQERSAID